MRVQLDQVQEETFIWEEEVALAASELDCPELIELGLVRCQGDVRFTRPGYLLRAQLGYRQTLACHRCLEPSPQDARYEFQLLVLCQSEPGQEPEEIELQEEDLDVLQIKGPSSAPSGGSSPT